MICIAFRERDNGPTMNYSLSHILGCAMLLKDHAFSENEVKNTFKKLDNGETERSPDSCDRCYAWPRLSNQASTPPPTKEAVHLCEQLVGDQGRGQGWVILGNLYLTPN